MRLAADPRHLTWRNAMTLQQDSTATSPTNSASNPPRYKIEKVGDSFVPVKQASPATDPEAAMWCAAGGIIGLFGLVRRGFVGPLMMLAGGLMIYRGCTGKNPLAGLLEGPNHAPEGHPSLA